MRKSQNQYGERQRDAIQNNIVSQEKCSLPLAVLIFIAEKYFA
jgi:hypothetical protein